MVRQRKKLINVLILISIIIFICNSRSHYYCAEFCYTILYSIISSIVYLVNVRGIMPAVLDESIPKASRIIVALYKLSTLYIISCCVLFYFFKLNSIIFISFSILTIINIIFSLFIFIISISEIANREDGIGSAILNFFNKSKHNTTWDIDAYETLEKYNGKLKIVKIRKNSITVVRLIDKKRFNIIESSDDYGQFQLLHNKLNIYRGSLSNIVSLIVNRSFLEIDLVKLDISNLINLISYFNINISYCDNTIKILLPTNCDRSLSMLEINTIKNELKNIKAYTYMYDSMIIITNVRQKNYLTNFEIK